MQCVNRSASQTSWTDQFFLFEALASSHIRRWTFQFVHCAASESDKGLVFEKLATWAKIAFEIYLFFGQFKPRHSYKQGPCKERAYAVINLTSLD